MPTLRTALPRCLERPALLVLVLVLGLGVLACEPGASASGRRPAVSADASVGGSADGSAGDASTDRPAADAGPRSADDAWVAAALDASSPRADAGVARMPAPVVRCSPGDCPAFPGAEGYGRNARGGRGGDVYHVTTLSDSGAGSLREGIEGARGPRTIVFDVAGRIDLRSPLRGRTSRLTLAGQTAPGDGIQVSGYQTELLGDDLIVQHLRFRAGDAHKGARSSGGFTEDALTIGGDDIIVDHVSASWGIDECLSAGADSFDRITVQWSFVTEGLYQTGYFHGARDSSYDPGGSHGHSMGSLFKPNAGDSHLTLHHDLWANNNNRNPALGSYGSDQEQWADVRNNVLFNWADNPGYASGESQAIHLDYVGNYGVSGPSTDDPLMFRAVTANHLRIFADGNYLDTNRNGRFDGRVATVIDGDYTRASSSHGHPAVVTHTAPEALELVLSQGGARPWSRDAVDLRIVADARAGRGRLIDSQSQVGGWGTLARGSAMPDRDGDGMPDAWEESAGTDPDHADPNGDVDGDGYTNLEGYLHWAARLER